MGALQISTVDYLFIKHRSMTIKLEDVCSEYYPHLTRAEMLRRANNQEFPFSCFKLEPENKRAPFLVHVADLANILDKKYASASKDFAAFHQ